MNTMNTTNSIAVSVKDNDNVKKPNEVTERRYGFRYRKTFPLLIMLIAFILVWGGLAYAQADLKADVPALCYKCHVKLKESLSRRHIHFPFKEGKCLSCHNSHTSDLHGLLNDEINLLCLNCHVGLNNLLKEASIHGALQKGVCTDCHYAHSGENKHLLVKEEKNICWDCHGTLKDQLGKPNLHIPFKDGKCSSCHNAHASSQDYQMIGTPEKVCKKCHSPLCKSGGISISFATKELDCTSCHTGHGSIAEGLLGPYGHTAFTDKKCEECHNPIIANRKITSRLSGKELCFNCHKKDPARFMDGDVHEGKGENACATCHQYHASNKKNLTVKEAGFCFTCHESTAKRTAIMAKTLKKLKCVPVNNRECFQCHIPLHSSQPLYFKSDIISVCTGCHKTQHKITHPLGTDVIDPRNGQPVTCITCHSMHSAKAQFMLTFDRKRQLCIQCHKK